MDEIQIAFLDPREISSIYYDGENAGGYSVGFSGVTRIACYQENGQMAPVPFFAVFQGDHLQARVPANIVTVTYKKATP